jgi:hypothetical protein
VSDDGDAFPVEPPPGVTPEAPAEPSLAERRGIPAAGSPEAKARAAKGAETRRRNREAKERRSASKGSGKVSEAAAIRAIRNDLATTARQAGGLMVSVTPIPGTYLLQTADDFADALANLASRNPKLLRSLQSGASVMDYVAIGAWGVGLGIAVAVQFGQVRADGPAARAYKIDEIAEEFYPPGEGPQYDDGDGDAAAVEGDPRFPAPDLLGSDEGDPSERMGAGTAL